MTDTLRDITIETADDTQAQRVIAAVRALPGVEIIHTLDRVLERHRGGTGRRGRQSIPYMPA